MIRPLQNKKAKTLSTSKIAHTAIRLRSVTMIWLPPGAVVFGITLLEETKHIKITSYYRTCDLTWFGEFESSPTGATPCLLIYGDKFPEVYGLLPEIYSTGTKRCTKILQLLRLNTTLSMSWWSFGWKNPRLFPNYYSVPFASENNYAAFYSHISIAYLVNRRNLQMNFRRRFTCSEQHHK